MKFWRVTSKDDSLAYYAFAANRESAVAVVEKLSGPVNPARRLVQELPERPKNYKLPGPAPCILDEDPEADE